MVQLSEGSPVIRTSAKWLIVWMSERCICDPTNTHLHNLTTRRLKPCRHTCSTWLAYDASNNRNTFGWLLTDRDNACATVDVTLCVSVTDVFIVNITCTHEAKTLSMTRTWSQERHWHQHAISWVEWTSKVSVKAHMSSLIEPECMQPWSKTLKGGSKIGCRPKFWRVVVTTTTLAGTLVQLQLL